MHENKSLPTFCMPGNVEVFIEHIRDWQKGMYIVVRVLELGEDPQPTSKA